MRAKETKCGYSRPSNSDYYEAVIQAQVNETKQKFSLLLSKGTGGEGWNKVQSSDL